jgi:hypothetical protein
MAAFRKICAYCALCTMGFVFWPGHASGQTSPSGATQVMPTQSPQAAQTTPGNGNATVAGGRDGQHDFDFAHGSWKTHIRRLLHPLTGSNTWVELNGTVVVRNVWGGRANLEEIEADGPTGHFEGMTLFLYNPQSHQWSQTFASSDDGTLEQPSIGEFKQGRGELFDQETFNGRTILARGVWSDITPNSHRFEQAFSDDGGKTWEPNFVATLTRESQ